MGCGMIDPNVLKAMGCDPKNSTEGLQHGRERIAMVLHQIDDIRRFYSLVHSKLELQAHRMCFHHPASLAAIIAVTTTQIRASLLKPKALNKASDNAGW